MPRQHRQTWAGQWAAPYLSASSLSARILCPVCACTTCSRPVAAMARTAGSEPDQAGPRSLTTRCPLCAAANSVYRQFKRRARLAQGTGQWLWRTSLAREAGWGQGRVERPLIGRSDKTTCVFHLLVPFICRCSAIGLLVRTRANAVSTRLSPSRWAQLHAVLFIVKCKSHILIFALFDLLSLSAFNSWAPRL